MSNDTKFNVQILGNASSFKDAAKDVEKAAEHLSSKLGDIGDIGSKGLGKVTSAALGLGKTVAEAGTVAAAGFAGGTAGIVKLAAGYEDAMAQLKASLPVQERTAENMAAIEKKASEVGQTTSFSSKEAALGLKEFAAQGLSTKDALEAIGPAAMAAELNAVDLADAAKTGSVVMNSFGLKATDLGHAFDVTTKAAQLGVLDFKDFNMAMAAVGSVAKLSNQSLEGTTSVLLALTNQGMSASDAGTSIKSALMAMQNPSAKAAMAMEELGMNIYDARGKMLPFSDIVAQVEKNTKGMTDAQRNQLLMSVAGSDGVRAFAASLSTGSTQLKQWEQGLINSNGEMKNSHEIVRNTLSAAFDNLKGSLEEAGISIGKTMLPAVTSLINKIIPLINTFTEWENKTHTVGNTMSLLIQGATEKFTGFVEFIKSNITNIHDAIQIFTEGLHGLAPPPGAAPLYQILGQIGLVLGDIVPKVMAVTTAFNPLTLAFAAIEGYMKGGLSGAIDAVTGKVVQAGKAFGIDLKGPMDVIGGILKDVLIPIFTSLEKAFTEHLLPAIGKFWQESGPKVMELLKQLGAFIADPVIPTIAKLVAMVIENVLPVLVDWWKILADTLLPVLSDVFKFIGDTVIPKLAEFFDYIQANVIPVVKEWAKVIGDILGGAFKVLKPIIETVLNVLFEGFKIGWPILKGIIDGIGTAVTGLGNFFKLAGTVIGLVWDGIRTGIGTAADLIKGIIRGIASFIAGILNGIIDGVNVVIRGLNAVNPFGKIGEIGRISMPSFAEGGIALKPMQAMVGDVPGGEAILPLSEMPKLFAQAMRQEVLPALGYGGGGDGSTYQSSTNVGGVNIYIQQAPGQNAQELALAIQQVLQNTGRDTNLNRAAGISSSVGIR